MIQNKSSPTLVSLRFFAVYGLMFLSVVPGILFVGFAALPSPLVLLVTWATAAVPFAFCLAGFLLLKNFGGESFPGSTDHWRRYVAYSSPLMIIGTFLLSTNAGPLVSLALFTLLFPFLCPFFAKASRTRALCLLALSFAASALPAIFVETQLLMLMRVWPEFLYPPGLSPLEFFRAFPPFHLGEFTFGMALARLYLLNGESSPARGELVFFLGLVFVPLLAIMGQRVPEPYVSSFAFLPAFALQLWGASTPRTVWLRLFEWRFFQLLGEASFVLFLLHGTLFTVARLLRNTYSPSLNPLWILLFMLVGSVPIAVLIHLCAEKPLRRKFASMI